MSQPVSPKLMDEAMAGITRLGFGHKVRILRYAADMGELQSCLREYVFGSDAKVDAFLKECKTAVALAQVADNKPLANY